MTFCLMCLDNQMWEIARPTLWPQYVPLCLTTNLCFTVVVNVWERQIQTVDCVPKFTGGTGLNLHSCAPPPNSQPSKLHNLCKAFNLIVQKNYLLRFNTLAEKKSTQKEEAVWKLRQILHKTRVIGRTWAGLSRGGNTKFWLLLVQFTVHVQLFCKPSNSVILNCSEQVVTTHLYDESTPTNNIPVHMPWKLQLPVKMLKRQAKQ